MASPPATPSTRCASTTLRSGEPSQDGSTCCCLLAVCSRYSVPASVAAPYEAASQQASQYALLAVVLCTCTSVHIRTPTERTPLLLHRYFYDRGLIASGTALALYGLVALWVSVTCALMLTQVLDRPCFPRNVARNVQSGLHMPTPAALPSLCSFNPSPPAPTYLCCPPGRWCGLRRPASTSGCTPPWTSWPGR